MRRIKIGIVALAAFGATACGGGTHFANLPRPPSPVNLTVFIDNQRVSVSPTSVGAGPIVFIVTNQASSAESLSVLTAGAGASQSLASTGPISPQATAQVTVNLNTPGDYSVAITPSSSTEAGAATPSGIQPAVIHIGKPRASASNQLLSP
jgi:hypothetical protein